MEKQLREFLEKYMGQGTQKNDIVTQEAVDLLVITATAQGIEQEIIDYGVAHPEAPFWDFLGFIKPGLDGITQEELLAEDED